MIQTSPTPAEIEGAIRNIADFPKPGIQFKDITPVLADARLFAGSIDLLTAGFKPGMVDAIVGIEPAVLFLPPPPLSGWKPASSRFGKRASFPSRPTSRVMIWNMELIHRHSYRCRQTRQPRLLD